MEKGMESCSWYSVLDKKTLSNTEFLGWMKQQQQQQQTNTTTTGSNITPHHDHDDDDGGGGATVASTNNIYPHESVISTGGYSIAGGHTPFHYPPSPSPGGGGMAMAMAMAMARELPVFTAGQWKELERQAMVYKCMISSVPVPPHLLYPLDSISSSSAPAPAAINSLLYCGGGSKYSRKGDLEPGRCKRTDGKKWRCSREVAPLQKYCDRHLHRGRPRSRKPVELNNNNNSALNHKKSRTKSPPLPLFKPKTNLTISTPYFNGANTNTNTNRNLGVVRQPWEEAPNPMQAEMEIGNQGLSDYRSSFDHDYAPLDLFSYPNITSQGMDMPLPAGFIGAKSLNDGDLSPSLNLSMAMAVGDVLDEQMRNIQTTKDDDDIDATAEDSVWLTNRGCWERGGPLGEALQPGASNPASPYSSSPSGVLQRTLFSHSDGSACNSPTANFRLTGN